MKLWISGCFYPFVATKMAPVMMVYFDGKRAVSRSFLGKCQKRWLELIVWMRLSRTTKKSHKIAVVLSYAICFYVHCPIGLRGAREQSNRNLCESTICFSPATRDGPNRHGVQFKHAPRATLIWSWFFSFKCSPGWGHDVFAVKARFFCLLRGMASGGDCRRLPETSPSLSAFSSGAAETYF